MTLTSHVAQAISWKSHTSWKSVCATTGLAIAVVLPIAAVNEAAPSVRVTAQCNDADTEDSFSMSCTPNIIPDTSDQLTEAEVAEPGFNARPGGFGGEGGNAVGGEHVGGEHVGGEHGGGGHAGGGGHGR